MTTLKRKETATASREEPPQNMEKSSAMEIDEIDSECSEATPKRPITPEIRVLSKEDQIKLRVKEHVSLWRQCQVATREGPTEKLRALLTTAQESQKVLQKLIDNEEIESYVKGWNPWDEKKTTLPFPSEKESNEIQEKRARQEAKLKLDQLLRSRQMEESHRPPSDGLRSVPECVADPKVAITILDSLETLNFNISTLDSNSESNFASIVHSLDSATNKMKENIELVCTKIIQQLNKPLPIELTPRNSEQLTIIQKDVEYLRDTSKDSKELINEIVQFSRNSAAQSNAQADYILSSIRQDAIVEKAKFDRTTSELKNLLIQKSADTDKKLDLLNEMILDKFSSIRNEISAVTRLKPDPQNDRNDLADKDSSQKEEKDLMSSHSNRYTSRDAPPHQTNNDKNTKKIK
ncbi:hypothetical protein PGT21_034430 [Puccinia graminis f. sp. tritici]|uniref:Uncharacterized protein n=1 Tax=Puccinia graminis f. sp. tritici TaxID=56615 RepID=A0A5B0R316_PUCGR|nr:hypothetical protein PGT21_034430 [Puccinia graminis f. sp. tritici]